VLVELFLHPQTLFYLQYDRWTRPLRLLVSVALLAGIVSAATRTPSLLEAAEDWGAWLRNHVRAVWYSDGRVGWEKPDELPHTTRHRGWRLDFVPPTTPVDLQGLGPEKRGVWIAADRVVCWWRGVDERVTRVNLFGDDSFWLGIDPRSSIPDGYRLEGRALEAAVVQTVRRVLPLLYLKSGLSLVLEALFYVAMFAVIPVILRSSMGRRGFGRSFSFYAYAGVIPALVAAVYDAVNVVWLTRTLVYVVVFFLYLVMASRAALREAGGDPESGAD
jgi:hypothetical protein